MDFSQLELSGDDARFREEVKALLSEQLTAEVRAAVERSGSSWSESLCRELGRRGWILPERAPEHGGVGLSERQAEILELELQRADAPLMALGTTLLTVPAIEQFGSPDLVAEVVPGIARGEVRVCLGYSEPDGGSDIAAAKTRARRDGEEWIVNGSKMFTTEAHNCRYAFLLARTDPDRPKHKGLSMFLLPLAAEGVEIGPIHTVGGERTNVVYLTDVRLADRFRLGEVNDGWRVLMGPLSAEHGKGGGSSIGLPSNMGAIGIYTLQRALESALAWAVGGASPAPIEDPVVRHRLAKVAVELEAAAVSEDPMGRVYASDACIRGCSDLLALVGPRGVIAAGEESAIDDGAFERAHRFAQGTSIYGGTVEIFKNMVAQHVLGLPRQLPQAR